MDWFVCIKKVFYVDQHVLKSFNSLSDRECFSEMSQSTQFSLLFANSFEPPSDFHWSPDLQIPGQVKKKKKIPVSIIASLQNSHIEKLRHDSNILDISFSRNELNRYSSSYMPQWKNRSTYNCRPLTVTNY